ATIGWDDRFTYGILPTLIQEMKNSGGAGGTRGPRDALVSGHAPPLRGPGPPKTPKGWEQPRPPHPAQGARGPGRRPHGGAPGGILGSGVFQQDPYQWTQQYLVPAMVKAGYDTEGKQRQALQYLFPNRTAGFVMAQLALQGWKFDRDQKLIGQAAGLAAYNE